MVSGEKNQWFQEQKINGFPRKKLSVSREKSLQSGETII